MSCFKREVVACGNGLSADPALSSADEMIEAQIHADTYGPDQ